MKALIHQTPEEKLANSSQSVAEATAKNTPKLDEINQNLRSLYYSVNDRSGADSATTALLESQREAIRKLEEVKSATLITNKFLKDISKKEVQPSELIRVLRGEKGDSITGVRGPKGDTVVGPPGKDGKDGHDGLPGKDGKVGPKGLDGKDGVDGSPDKPDEIVDKINVAKKKIDPAQVKGLRTVMQTVESLDQVGKHPKEYQNVGGANPLIMLNSSGARISDYITTLKFSTNLTPTYSAGQVTLTAAGATIYSETPGGAVDGANKVYTTANAVTTVLTLAINGQFIHPSEYTVAGSGFTMGTALPAGLSGTGFTIVYQ